MLTHVDTKAPPSYSPEVAAGCPAGDHAAFSDKMNDSGVGFGLWCYYPLSLFMFCAWCIVSIKDPSLDVAILDTFDGQVLSLSLVLISSRQASCFSDFTCARCSRYRCWRPHRQACQGTAQNGGGTQAGWRPEHLM